MWQTQRHFAFQAKCLNNNTNVLTLYNMGLQTIHYINKWEIDGPTYFPPGRSI